MHVCVSGARNWRVRTHNCAKFIMHEKVVLQNLLMVNMVQKSANHEEIKGKDGKYCVCNPVYIGL